MCSHLGGYGLTYGRLPSPEHTGEELPSVRLQTLSTNRANRFEELCDLSDLKQRENARRVCKIFHKRQINKKEGFYRLDLNEIPTLSKHYEGMELGEGIRELQEQLVSPCGTGFLVRPGLVATAAHVVTDPNTKAPMKLKELRFLFDFSYIKSGDQKVIKTEYEYNQVRRAKSLFASSGMQEEKEIDEREDWALVELDEEMKMGEVSFRGGAVQVGERLYTIGHPMGMPLKKVTGEVKKMQGLILQTNFGTWEGNSGSPVFGTDHQVVGMIYAGTNYFKSVGNRIEINRAEPVDYSQSLVRFGKNWHDTTP